MSIPFLSSENFVVMGRQNKVLGINVPGNVLVFFKIQGDPNCTDFEPVFVQLSHKEDRVTYATLDVKQNREVIKSSRETTTAIETVPLLILYINGRPHAKFSGTKNVPSIRNFITKALQTNMSNTSAPRQQFMSGNAGGVPTGGGRGIQTSAKSYIPDIGTAPSMKGVIKGAGKSGGSTGYISGMNVEEEEEPRLLIPDSVIPHNTPWEAEFNNQ